VIQQQAAACSSAVCPLAESSSSNVPLQLSDHVRQSLEHLSTQSHPEDLYLSGRQLPRACLHLRVRLCISLQQPPGSSAPVPLQLTAFRLRVTLASSPVLATLESQHATFQDCAYARQERISPHVCAFWHEPTPVPVLSF
jgi:hypothetical protein